MIGRLLGQSQPQQDVGGLDRSARAIDSDRFDRTGTFAAQSRCIRQND